MITRQFSVSNFSHISVAFPLVFLGYFFFLMSDIARDFRDPVQWIRLCGVLSLGLSHLNFPVRNPLEKNKFIYKRIVPGLLIGCLRSVGGSYRVFTNRFLLQSRTPTVVI